MAELIPISLAYAPTATEQHYVECEVVKGTTLIEALAEQGWLEQFSELGDWCAKVQKEASASIRAKAWHVGVYAQKQPLDYVLLAHDRVEVYRSLLADPMKIRKKRANAKPKK